MDAHTVDLVSQRLLGNDGLFRKRGTTVILATHSRRSFRATPKFMASMLTTCLSIDKLMSFADTIVALEDGRIAEVGSPQTLLAYEGYAAKLGLTLRDGDPIREHDNDTEISRIESAAAESFISVPRTLIDEVNDTLDSGRKKGDWSVYRYYFASSGYTIIIVFLMSMAVWIFCTEFASMCTRSRSHP